MINRHPFSWASTKGQATILSAIFSPPSSFLFEKSMVLGYQWFESISAHLWPVGQAVKTPPFHGGNVGSTPARVTSPIFGVHMQASLKVDMYSPLA